MMILVYFLETICHTLLSGYALKGLPSLLLYEGTLDMGFSDSVKPYIGAYFAVCGVVSRDFLAIAFSKYLVTEISRSSKDLVLWHDLLLLKKYCDP